LTAKSLMFSIGAQLGKWRVRDFGRARSLRAGSDSMKWPQIVALAALCSAFFLVELRFAPHHPEISPDSFLFLAFKPDKTAGYPMFLALVGWFDNELSRSTE
jgi:hypothetical protein